MLHKFIYKLLPELPKLPQYFIDSANAGANIFVENQGSHKKTITRHLTDWRGMSYTAPRILRGKFSDEFESWVKDNITQTFKDAGIAYFPGTVNTPSCGGHTDATRDYVLIYNANQGGPNAELCYWQEDGQPLVRERATQGITTKNLKLIAAERKLADTWYLLNTRIIHSLENITEPRINFQISFDTEIPPEVLKYFDNV